MGGVGVEFGGEEPGLFVPAEDDGAAAEAGEEGRAGEDGVGEGAPEVEEDDDAGEGEESEEAGDGWVEFENQRDAEVGGEPEGGAFEDGVEALVAAKEQAGVVEAELGKGGDEEGDADEEERKVSPEGCIRNVDTDAAERRFVAEEPAEEEAGERDGGVAGEQRERDDGVAKRIGRAAHGGGGAKASVERKRKEGGGRA